MERAMKLAKANGWGFKFDASPKTISDCVISRTLIDPFFWKALNGNDASSTVIANWGFAEKMSLEQIPKWKTDRQRMLDHIDAGGDIDQFFEYFFKDK